MEAQLAESFKALPGEVQGELVCLLPPTTYWAPSKRQALYIYFLVNPLDFYKVLSLSLFDAQGPEV